MTGIVRACCLSCVTLAVVVPARADEQAEARKIIDKAIQAHGGAAALAKYPALSMKSKGRYFGMGEGIDYTGVFGEGRLIRGDNPVLMTMELVLEILD